MIREPDSQEKEKKFNKEPMNTDILNEISIFKSSHMQRKNIVGEILSLECKAGLMLKKINNSG